VPSFFLRFTHARALGQSRLIHESSGSYRNRATWTLSSSCLRSNRLDRLVQRETLQLRDIQFFVLKFFVICPIYTGIRILFPRFRSNRLPTLTCESPWSCTTQTRRRTRRRRRTILSTRNRAISKAESDGTFRSLKLMDAIARIFTDTKRRSSRPVRLSLSTNNFNLLFGHRCPFVTHNRFAASLRTMSRIVGGIAATVPCNQTDLYRIKIIKQSHDIV